MCCSIFLSCKIKAPLSPTQIAIINQFPKNIVIAHRGTTFYAPEETEAAMRWARNSGAHYLEFDLQRTKDGYLVALHDESLLRTSNVKDVFPNRINDKISQFTYQELLKLNFGSWFNLKYPELAKPEFEYQDILTLEDIINIAEGKKIKRDISGKRIIRINETGKIESTYILDETDQGNRPGIYVETKIPQLYPNIEIDLKNQLESLLWYNADTNKLKVIETKPDKINVANTVNRVVLQTFSKESLIALNNTFERKLPTCFLLWRGNDSTDDIPNDDLKTFEKWVNFGVENGATIIGPSIGGEPNNYVDLLTEKHYQIIRKKGLLIHAYSFDTQEQWIKYKPLCDGVFSNK